MDDGGPIFQDPSSMISEHNGIGVPYQGALKQDHIIRNDKLLTDGERISQPDSSDSDFCSTSSSDPRYNIINNRDSFTLNQNVHDTLLTTSSSIYRPPPPMTCMAPLGSNGKGSHIRRESSYLPSVNKVEASEEMMQDPMELNLLSSPTSSSWIGKVIVNWHNVTLSKQDITI